jgi:hypothetical protein
MSAVSIHPGTDRTGSPADAPGKQHGACLAGVGRDLCWGTKSILGLACDIPQTKEAGNVWGLGEEEANE